MLVYLDLNTSLIFMHCTCYYFKKHELPEDSQTQEKNQVTQSSKEPASPSDLELEMKKSVLDTC